MEQLRIPGPTPCPPEVLQAMTKQMINHRGEEFIEILNGVTDKLKQVFQTKNDVFILTGSGTGGLEAVIVNTLSPGDRVLSVSNGVFAERFATIAQRFGAEIIPLRFEWGKGVDAGLYVDVSPEYFLDKLKAAIPGEVDDKIIDMLKLAFKVS